MIDVVVGAFVGTILARLLLDVVTSWRRRRRNRREYSLGWNTRELRGASADRNVADALAALDGDVAPEPGSFLASAQAHVVRAGALTAEALAALDGTDLAEEILHAGPEFVVGLDEFADGAVDVAVSGDLRAVGGAFGAADVGGGAGQAHESSPSVGPVAVSPAPVVGAGALDTRSADVPTVGDPADAPASVLRAVEGTSAGSPVGDGDDEASSPTEAPLHVALADLLASLAAWWDLDDVGVIEAVSLLVDPRQQLVTVRAELAMHHGGRVTFVQLDGGAR